MKFYTLSEAAGMIRSNKFRDKADAICVGSHRAETRQVPIKIYEHDGQGSRESILVCCPDGSVEKPQALAHEQPPKDQGNAESKTVNEAHLLMASYEYQRGAILYLSSPVSETLVGEIEKEVGVSLGYQDDHTVLCYSGDRSDLAYRVEQSFAAHNAPVKYVSPMEPMFEEALARVEKEIVEGSIDPDELDDHLVVAARKGHKLARSSQMPELSVKASSKFGGAFKFKAHCEVTQSEKGAPKIMVFCDGEKVGECKSDREAASMIRDHAEKAFSRYIRKEL